MPIEDLQGAWRIEEARGWTGKEHKYAKPNTHWLILGNHGIPIIQNPPDPLYFEFRITLDEATHPQTLSVIGLHGGSGFFELTDELLIVTIGGGGIKPPRFEFGCGNYFAFTRDHGIELPQPPTWSRKAITSQRLGEIIWNPTDKRWTGSVELPDGNECEIWAVDDLMPIAIFLSKLGLVHQWLCDDLKLAKTVCAESVEQWIDEMPEFSHLSLSEITETIKVNSISAVNGKFHLWASTSIPIDHSIRLWIEMENGRIFTNGASIEG